VSRALSLRPAGPVVGYDPVALDASIRRYAGVAERNLALAEELGKQLPTLLDHLKNRESSPTMALEDTEALSIIYDRFVKAGTNLTKAIDELCRLRSFLSGGPDSRPDLTSASEIELRAIVLAAVKTLGVTDLSQLESAGS